GTGSRRQAWWMRSCATRRRRGSNRCRSWACRARPCSTAPRRRGCGPSARPLPTAATDRTARWSRAANRARCSPTPTRWPNASWPLPRGGRSPPRTAPRSRWWPNPCACTATPPGRSGWRARSAPGSSPRASRWRRSPGRRRDRRRRARRRRDGPAPRHGTTTDDDEDPPLRRGRPVAGVRGPRRCGGARTRARAVAAGRRGRGAGRADRARGGRGRAGAARVAGAGRGVGPGPGARPVAQGPGGGDGGRVHTLEVRYDGPDVSDVADLTGLPVAELVRRHTAVTWRAAFGGFAPGFSYLVDDRELG